MRCCRHRSGAKSACQQRHTTAQVNSSGGQAVRADLAAPAPPSGPLGPLGFGLSSTSGLTLSAPQTQASQVQSHTRSQHCVEFQPQYTYVEELDHDDAVSEPDQLLPLRPQSNSPTGTGQLQADPTLATLPPEPACAPVPFGELGVSRRVAPEVSFAPSVPSETTRAPPQQPPAARPTQFTAGGESAADVGLAITKQDLTDFAAQIKTVRPPVHVHSLTLSCHGAADITLFVIHL